jgi:hypothetical protein
MRFLVDGGIRASCGFTRKLTADFLGATSVSAPIFVIAVCNVSWIGMRVSLPLYWLAT